MLIDFILDDVSEKQHKCIIEEIKNNESVRSRYLTEKRKIDAERYLSDEMFLGERIEFEDLLENDSNLKKHFELSEDINFAINIMGLTEALEEVMEEEETKAIVKRKGLLSDNKIFVRWLAAASILFLLTFGSSLYWFSDRDTVENRLYAKYYEPYSKTGTHFFNSSTLDEAKEQYKSKNYNLALMLLETLPDAMTIENEKILFSGLTFMELERYEKAIKEFKNLQLSNGNETSMIIADWYVGLCYLKTGDKAKAIKYFEKNVAHNGYNSNQAKKILKKLK
jgi:tetratricopeptide (TPR) repeat protein